MAGTENSTLRTAQKRNTEPFNADAQRLRDRKQPGCHNESFKTELVIFLLIYFQQDATSQFIYFWKTALHVSGGISTHHQEYIQLYLRYLVLVNRYCYLPLLWESWSWSECGVGIVKM